MALDPTPLTETATFDAEVHAPLAGSIPITKTDVSSGLNALANRTRYIKEDAAGGLPSKYDKTGGAISGNVTVAGNLSVSGASFACAAAASFSGAVSLDDITSVNAPMTVQGDGSLTIASTGTLAVAGPMTRTGASALTGDGATSGWRGQDVAPGVPAATLSVARDFYHVTSPSSGATSYTLASTPTPPAYAELEVAVYGLPNAATLAFVRDDATTIATLLGGSATAQAVLRFRFVTDPGEWRLMSTFLNGVTLTVGSWNS
jgi:hypothetical protein